jgi:hypothetical protein
MWKIKQNYRKVNSTASKPLLATHPVHTPEYLNIKMFPHESKKIIERRLKESIVEIYEVIDEVDPPHKKETKIEVVKILAGYIKFMFQEDYSEHADTFWIMNNRMDEIRGTKLSEFIPELLEVL